MELFHSLRILHKYLIDSCLDSSAVGYHQKSFFLHVSDRLHIVFQDLCKYFFRICLIDFSSFDRLDQVCQVFRGKVHIFGFHSFFFQQPQPLSHQPVGCLFRVSAQIGGLFEHICHMFGLGQNGGIICRKTVLFFVSGCAFFLKFRLTASDLFHPFRWNLHRLQIRIRKITVVFCIFLRTHRMGGFFVIVPAAGLLNDFFSFFQQFDLTFSLTLDRMGNRFERVQVLHLGTGSHTIASHLSYGEIDVGTHGAFL